MSDTSRAEKWPNFFIVGAARAGTTALYEYLKTVPGVYLPGIKEPRHFLARSETEDIYGRSAVGGRQKYLDLFAESDAAATGEATPEYLYHKNVAQKIHETIPSARILITLRNPVTRAFSHYLLLRRLLNIKHTFQELLLAEYGRLKDESRPRVLRSPGVIECGFYSEGVRAYLDLFGPDRVKIIVFEQWTKDTLNTLNSILQFLQVGHRLDRQPEIAWENASRIDDNKVVASMTAMANNRSTLLGRTYRRLPGFAKDLLRDSYYRRVSGAGSSHRESMPAEAGTFLQGIYREDVESLRGRLGIVLPWEDFKGSRVRG